MKLGLISLSLLAAAGCATKDKVVVAEPAQASPTAQDVPAGETPSGPLAAPSGAPSGEAWGILEPKDTVEYGRVVTKVANMVSDAPLQQRVRARQLSLVNVMWEDTGRAQGSSLGPNISDLTLQVRRKDERDAFQTALMPVIRPPNFSDRTGDIPADRFFIRVGNQRAGGLRTVALTEVLKNIKAFASRPEGILGDGNLLAPRDTHFLASAQAVFLPIPKSGKAEFNPVLFNYQSAPGSPAVLSILVTRQGTSMRVIENRGEDRSSQGGGQELYFNHEGQRASFTAERKTDVEQRIMAQGGPKTEDDKSALQKGADVLFLVQVPLKHRDRGVLGGALPPAMPAKEMAKKKPMAMAAGAPAAASREASDVEQAVLGHGPNLGPYQEGNQLRIERDPKFPIRVTVQFYKATSNGVVSDADLDSIARSIGSVYEHADAVGSLVLPEGDAARPTAWQKVPHEWFPW